MLRGLSRFKLASLLVFAFFGSSGMCFAHDLWIEPSSNLVRLGESVTLQLKLGNCEHGKATGKTSGMLPRESVHLAAHLPGDKLVNISNYISSTTLEGNPGGCWTTRYRNNELGCTWLLQSMEETVIHGGKSVRGHLFAKAPVLAATSLDDVVVGELRMRFDLPLEIVLVTTPLPSMASREAIKVIVMRDSKPLKNVHVAFTQPTRQTEREEDKTQYVSTNSDGIAEWFPVESGVVLISYQQIEESEHNSPEPANYFSSTLTLNVSQAVLYKTAESLAPD